MPKFVVYNVGYNWWWFHRNFLLHHPPCSQYRRKWTNSFEDKNTSKGTSFCGSFAEMYQHLFQKYLVKEISPPLHRSSTLCTSWNKLSFMEGSDGDL